MTKSSNKHNRIYCKASDLSNELADEIEKGIITPKDDPKVRANVLYNDHGIDKD